MRSVWGIVVAVGLALATLVAPGNATAAEQQCYADTVCAPSAACLDGVYCQATPCDPATNCRARPYAREECGLNQTNMGQTCATRAGADATVGGRNTVLPGTWIVPGNPIPPLSVDVPAAGAEAGVEHTRGFVHQVDLPNDWISTVARVRVHAAGIELGETTITAYQSSIRTPASDNGTNPHTHTRAILTLRHEGAVASTGGSFGIVLLDSSLESCLARAGPRNDVELSCRAVTELL